jgi:hypothetical protein
MSLAPKPGYVGTMLTKPVTVEVTTESPVHVCDRCGVQETRPASSKSVETDRDWKEGRVYMADAPAGWRNFRIGGPVDQHGNQEHGSSAELCPPCYAVVAEAWEGFFTTSGLRAGEEIRCRLYDEAKAVEKARLASFSSPREGARGPGFEDPGEPAD